jgi:hypothetical protein
MRCGATDSLSVCRTVDGPRTRRGRSLRHSYSKEPDGHRGNDYHYMNKIKQQARKGMSKRGSTVVLMPRIMSETMIVISDNNSQ